MSNPELYQQIYSELKDQTKERRNAWCKLRAAANLKLESETSLHYLVSAGIDPSDAKDMVERDTEFDNMMNNTFLHALLEKERKLALAKVGINW